MTGSAALDVQRAMGTIAAGRALPLGGRSVNSSYLVVHGRRQFSVKVHCVDQSSKLSRQRIELVDVILRDVPWYPRIVDVGVHGSGPAQLVVIRRFAPGTPSECAPKDLIHLVSVLEQLAALGDGLAIAEHLVGDYAVPWLSSCDRERQMLGRSATGEFAGLARTVDEHVNSLVSSASRLTRAGGVVVYHGDLHCRNLVLGRRERLTVIDWDEAGFSNRPADVAKALWLACRKERGDFALDPTALRDFLTRIHASLRFPYARVADVARLGAIWFLPRHGHVTQLRQRDEGLAQWYLGWVGRFWSRFAENLDLVAVEAARLQRETGLQS